MSDHLQSQIDSLDNQIANYDSERYSCSRSELIYRQGRLQRELTERLKCERKQARKAAKNRLPYYRSLVDRIVHIRIRVFLYIMNGVIRISTKADRSGQ